VALVALVALVWSSAAGCGGGPAPATAPGPEVDLPEVELPEIELPEVDLPEVELPEIELPEVERPATTTLPATTAATEAPATTTTAPATNTLPATTAATEAPATTVVNPAPADPEPDPAPPTSTTGRLLDGLVVVDNPTPGGYDRSNWRHWTDDDGDCQDTRQEVLIAESLIPVVLDAAGCRVEVGRWRDPFTGTIVDDQGDLDVDHLVPLAEAHAAGGWTWHDATRRAFANDLDDPVSLVAVTASVNRSKGAQRPDQWLPPDAGHHCAYAAAWVAVKHRWELSVTSAERDALAGVLDNCGEPTNTVPATTAPATTVPEPAMDPVPENPGNIVNCSDFGTRGEAQAWYDTYAPFHGDVARLDGDGDGEACESLPAA